MTATEFARGGNLRRLREAIMADENVTAAAVAIINAANPPASQELSEQPAGHAAPAAPSRRTRRNRPAATTPTEVLP